MLSIMQIFVIWAIVFVVGIVFGTQMPWYYELTGIAIGVLITNFGPWEEMEMIFPMFATIFFGIGCIIGDISWAVQTGNLPGIGELINSIGNLFTVDN